MQYLGFALLVLCAIAIVAALLQMHRGKKIGAVPFRRTGELGSGTQAGDPKQSVSCEGMIQISEPLTAPYSGKPCIYYTSKLEKEVEKSTLTEDGAKNSKQWKVVEERTQGTVFQVDDGSGAVSVCALADVDAELEESFCGPPGTTGGLASAVSNALSGGPKYRATERILPAQGKVFVLGRFVDKQIEKSAGSFGKLLLSPKGRDGLMASTKRTSTVAFAVAAAALVGGIPLSIFGSPSKTDACPNEIVGALAESCKGKITTDEGRTWSWTVTSAGEYSIVVKQPNVKLPIWADVTLRDSSGRAMAHQKGVGKGEDAKIVANLSPGTYQINVHDTVTGYAKQFASGGGLSFWMDIKGPSTPTSPTSPVDSAELASGDSVPEAPAALSAAPKPMAQGPGAAAKPASRIMSKPAPKTTPKPAPKPAAKH